MSRSLPGPRWQRTTIGGEAADLNVVQQGGASRAGLGWCGGERRCCLPCQPPPYPPVDDVPAIELATSTLRAAHPRAAHALRREVHTHRCPGLTASCNARRYRLRGHTHTHPTLPCPTLNPQCPPTGRPDPGTLIRGIWYLSYTVMNRHAAVAAAALAAGRASRGTVAPPQGHGETRAGLGF